MFRSLINVLVASSMLASSTAQAAGMSGEAGQFFFRYKTDATFVSGPQNPVDPVSKDITAFFVGGVGYALSEKLPMKAEWQDDDWRIVNGSLPDGITFDPATLTFTGTPTTEGTGTVVELEGFDANGASIATASANFDVYAIQGTGAPVDLYAHTGKYKVDTLSIPAGVTVDSWRRVYMPPDGIAVNGPYFQGTPTKAGVYPVFIQGLNYMGEVVATFHGKYTVEDGPTFPNIPDNVKLLPRLEGGSYGLSFNFGAPNPYKPNRLIDPAKPASFYLELDSGEELPFGVLSNDKSKDLNLKGYVRAPYETAKIRFKAVDSDATSGYSNWFTFGSSDPQPGCNPYYNGDLLTVKTGVASTISVPRPWGAQGTVTYHLVSGAFPDGITLGTDTGRIEGTATVAGQKTDIGIRVDVTNGSNTVSATCAYKMEVVAGNVRLSDATAAQAKHIRAGDVYTGTLNVTGGITPYEVQFKTPSDWPTLSFTSSTHNSQAVTVAGPVNAAGIHDIGFVLAQGDTSTHDGRLVVNAHGPLDTGVVPTITVKRLADPKTWGAIPYDDTTVIPEVAAPGKFPAFAIDASASANGAPTGITLSGEFFTGTTTAAAGTYGPLTVTMTDFSGQTKRSNEFSLVVEPRDEIAVDTLTAPVFVVRRGVEQKATPVVVKQPYGAADLRIDWTLNDVKGDGLPSWLSFDRTTGEFSAAANIPFEDIDVYGPFTLTATDEEGSTVTSDEFFVEAQDWPNPSSSVVAPIKSNVSGDLSAGERQTTINVGNLKGHVLASTVIGGVDAVTFVSASPANPAGLTFDTANGVLSGIPSEEFDGIVTITFKDGEGRSGEIKIPLHVLPYPVVEMTAAEYDLPRLSAPSSTTPSITGTTVRGFWNSARFELDSKSTPLPDGLSVGSNGMLTGSTSAAIGTVAAGIRLKATTTAPDGTTLVAYTRPFTIKVVDAKPMTLSYSPDTATFRLRKDAAGNYVVGSKVAATPKPSGSYVAPLSYSLDQSQAQADGMTGTISINNLTGAITGQPDRLGKWPVYVGLKDAEQRSIASPVPVTVWGTLDGYVVAGDGNGGHAGGGDFRLRVGEPFATDPIAVSNVVGTPMFLISPAAPPSAPVFDALTGAFTDASAFEQSLGNYSIYVDVKDEDGRTFDPNRRPQYKFNVIRPLAVSVASSATGIASRQYSAADGDPIDVAFAPTVQYQMGNIRYGMSGDLPGTLVLKVYDDQGAFMYFEYKDGSGVTQHEVDATKLPLDALVFDTLSATLRGIPSQAGTFGGIKLVAYDDHMDDYIKSVPSRTDNNTAYSQDIAITVAPAAGFGVANMVGAVASNEETAYQYTTVPSLRSVTANAAYGKAPVWTAVSGTLPAGVTAVKGMDLSYAGYPTAKGTFGDIVWKATDAAGRTVTTQAATITVEQRKELELAATNPVSATVNAPMPDMAVTPRFAAYGNPIGQSKWTVTGVSNLPPGITHTVEDNRVVFTGTPTVIGTYRDIVVSAVDSLGSSASVNLTFDISLPTDAIVLNVSDIRTKVGIPFEMQATSSNTYGKVRYYSYDIVGDLASQLSLDADTGLVAGAFNSVQNLDFDVYVTDGSNRITTKPVIVEVMPNLRLTAPEIVQFEPAKAQTRAIATDYVLGTASYAAVNPSAWPAGMTVDPATGDIVSDGTTPIGEYPDLAVRATDTFTRVGQTFTDAATSNTFMIKVDTNSAYIALSGGELTPWSKRKVGYSHDMANDPSLDFRGMGLAEIAFTFPAQPTGKRVPPGIVISSAGLITGTPTESGDFVFDVQAAHKSNSKVKSVATYTMHIDLLPLTLDLADAALPQAESGKAYSFDFKTLLTAVNVPQASIQWTKANVDPTRPLPSGLALSNGVLSGTPTGADDYDFTVKVSYTNNNPAVETIDHTRQYKLYVKKAAPYFIGTISSVTKAIRQTVTITPNFGNKHAADVYELVGSFPAGLFYDAVTPIAPGDTAPGLMFDKTTGAISGATRVAGEFPVQIKVTDKLGQSAVSNTFTLKFVDNVPTFVGTFEDKVGVEKNVTYIYSNPILVYGNVATAPTTFTTPAGVTGYARVCASIAEVQTGICTTSAAFSGSTVRQVPSGSYIQVLMVSSNSFDTEVVGTLDVGGVVREFKVKTRPTDTEPDDLAQFAPVSGVEPSRSIPSNVVKITGISDATPIKIELIEGDTTNFVGFTCATGYELSGDCTISGRYTQSISGNGKTVVNGDYLQLRVQSSATYGQTVRVKVTVGTTERIFSVTTRPLQTEPDHVGEFTALTGVERNAYVVSNIVKVQGNRDDAPTKIELIDGTSNSVILFKCVVAVAESGDCTTSGRNSGTIQLSTTGAKITEGTPLQFRVLSPTGFGETVRVKLTVGSTERVFSITTTPDGTFTAPTTFTDAMNTETNVLTVSNTIMISGLPSSATATLTLAEGTATTATAYVCKTAAAAYQGLCYTNSTYYKSFFQLGNSGTVSNGDFVQLRGTSSTLYDTAFKLRLTVNGESKDWTIKTRASDTTPTLNTFEDVTGVDPGVSIVSNVIKVAGITDSATASITVLEGTPTSVYARVCNSTYTDSNQCSLITGQYRTTINAPTGSTQVNINEGLVVRLVAPNAAGETAKVKLTVGDVERVFTVTTRIPNTVPTEVGEFITASGIETGVRVPSNIIQVKGFTDATTAKLEKVEGIAGNGDANLYVCKPGAAMAGDCFSSSSQYSSTVNVAGTATASVPPDAYIQVVAKSSSSYDGTVKVKATIGGVERLFEVKTRSIDTTPENLDIFLPVNNAALNATVTSEAIWVTDIKDTTPVTVSVTGSANATTKVFVCTSANAIAGKCSTNPSVSAIAGGAAVNITDGNYIALQTNSAATPGTEVKVTVTVGDVSRTWSVKTAP